MKSSFYLLLLCFGCGFATSAQGDGFDDLIDALNQISEDIDEARGELFHGGASAEEVREIDKKQAQADAEMELYLAEQKRKAEEERVKRGGFLVVNFSEYPAPFTIRITSYIDPQGKNHNVNMCWNFDSIRLPGRLSDLVWNDMTPVRARSVNFLLETTEVKLPFTVDQKHLFDDKLTINVSPQILPLPAGYIATTPPPLPPRQEVQRFEVVREVVPESPYNVGDYVQNTRFFSKWIGRVVWTDGVTFRVRITFSEHPSYAIGDHIEVVADDVKPAKKIGVYHWFKGATKN